MADKKPPPNYNLSSAPDPSVLKALLSQAKDLSPQQKIDMVFAGIEGNVLLPVRDNKSKFLKTYIILRRPRVQTSSYCQSYSESFVYRTKRNICIRVRCT